MPGESGKIDRCTLPRLMLDQPGSARAFTFEWADIGSQLSLNTECRIEAGVALVALALIQWLYAGRLVTSASSGCILTLLS